MWDGTIAVFLNLDESGGTVPGTNLVWTGDASSYSSPGVTGSHEWSHDMANWHPSGSVGDTTVTIGASRNDPVAGTTTVTADTAGSVTPPGRLFVRVVATRN